LTNSKTIGIGTGAVGTATSFNGTSNITIPITEVKEAYANWGGKNITGNVSPSDMGCIDEFGHNKLAFLPASCVKVEYTINGGSTWLDYGLTDAQKIQITTTSGVSMYIGKGTVSAKDGTLTNANCGNYKVRVTISTRDANKVAKLYTASKKWLINVSTNGANGSKVLVEERTIGNYNNNANTWNTVGTYDVSGWSGWNSIPYVKSFGGGSNQTGQIADVRFTLYITSVNTANVCNACMLDFRLIGATNWTCPSELARAGHVYTTDTSQNVTFPASVKIGGSLQKSSYTYTLPNKTGTVAMTSDLPTVPTKTSDLTNDSNFVVDSSYVHTDNNFNNIYKNQIGTNASDITNISTYRTDVDNIVGTFAGRPLHRKTIAVNQLPNNTSKAIATGLTINSTHCVVVRMSGIAYYQNGITFPLPFASNNGNAYHVALNIDNSNNVVITTGQDRTGMAGYIVLEYINMAE